jgi:peptide-methionine (S)-S-oxide reductase
MNDNQYKKAVVAGGCFWGLEDLLRTIPGIVDTEVGYTGGKNDNPTYEFHPDHAEAVEITYDPQIISYQQILDHFFRMHNPTTLNRQGNDVGTSYRSAIFYASDAEKQEAETMIEIVNESGRWPDPVVTTREPLTRFWPAEGYHQDYLVKNPGGYTCHAIYFDSYLS